MSDFSTTSTDDYGTSDLMSDMSLNCLGAVMILLVIYVICYQAPAASSIGTDAAPSIQLIEQAQQRQRELQEHLESVENQRRDAEGARDDAQVRVAELQERLDRSKEEQMRLQQEISAGKEERSKSEAEQVPQSEMQEKLEGLRQQLSQRERQLAAAVGSKAKIENDLARLQAENEQMSRQSIETPKKIADLESQLEKVRSEKKDVDKMLENRSEESIVKVTEKMAALERQLAEVRKREIGVQKELEEQKTGFDQRVKRLNQSNQELKEQLNSTGEWVVSRYDESHGWVHVAIVVIYSTGQQQGPTHFKLAVTHALTWFELGSVRYVEITDRAMSVKSEVAQTPDVLHKSAPGEFQNNIWKLTRRTKE